MPDCEGRRTFGPMPNKLRVLLAEDDLVQREVLQELLELEGYQVVATGSSKELLGRLPEGADAVLLDVVGVATTEVRDAIDHLEPRPKVLLVSGQPKLPEVGRRFGADACVPKPFDVDELLSALKGALGEAVASP